MTDRHSPPPGDRTAQLRVIAAASLAEAVERLRLDAAPAGLVLLPSTLSRRDRLAAAIRARLRAGNVPTHLLAPNGVVSALIGRGRAGGPTWRTVEIAPPDRPAARVTLPAQLLEAPARWTVTDVGAVHGRGPYALDLLARYLHPWDRLRLLASRARVDATVDVNLATPTSRHLVLGSFPGMALLASTADPIAAELLALSLAEENHSANVRVEGIWEDRVIQRATELDLGIQVPHQVRIALDGADSFPDAWPLVARLASRIGVRFP